MIRSFKDSRTERLFNGEEVREFQAFARQVEKRLRILDAADTLRALQMLPSHRLKALKRDRQGQYSIRINQQWRMCFEWREDSPHTDASWRNPQR
jgi:toxin HigB-1